MPKGMTAIRAELEAKSPMICYSGALVVDEEDHPIYSVAMPHEVMQKSL
jgi:hydroxymethylpyrimidine pyrophosphatase-like HAD family hydrolase